MAPSVSIPAFGHDRPIAGLSSPQSSSHDDSAVDASTTSSNGGMSEYSDAHSTSTIRELMANTGMRQEPINPRPFLDSMLGKNVTVRLKWNKTEYIGILESVDSYFNLQLSSAEEFIDRQIGGKLGMMFIRCNNVLMVRGADETLLEMSRKRAEEIAKNGGDASLTNGSSGLGGFKREMDTKNAQQQHVESGADEDEDMDED